MRKKIRHTDREALETTAGLVGVHSGGSGQHPPQDRGTVSGHPRHGALGVVREAIRCADNAILIIGIDGESHGNVAAANSAAAALYGCTVADLVGRHAASLVENRCGAALNAWCFGARSPEGYPFDATCLRSDGSTFHATLRGVRPDGERGEWLMISVAPVQELRETAHPEVDRRSQLETTLEAAMDAILMVDNRGKIEHVNRKFIELWDISGNDLGGGDYLETMEILLSRLRFPDRVRRSIKGIPSDADTEFCDTLELNDGRVVERCGRARRDGGRLLGWVWSYRDITDQRKMEATLIASEERFRSVIEMIGEGLMIIGRDNVIQYVNRRMTGMMEYGARELAGEPMTLLLCDDEGRRLVKEKSDLCMKSIAATYEINMRKKNGEVIRVQVSASPLFDPRGKVVGSIGVFTDVTLRKKADDALQESEARYHRLVDLSPDAIAVHSDGRVVYANPAAVTLIGAARAEEVIGKPMYEIVHPDYHDTVKARVQTVLRDHTKIPLLEEKFIRLDGQVIDVEVAAMPFTFEGKPAVQTVIRDVTERKRADEQIKASLREKEVLLKEIHHRVKNNLQIVSSLLNLQMGYVRDATALEVLRESQNRIRSMALIHEKLYQAGSLAHVDMAEYLRGLVTHLFRSYRSSANSVRLKMDISEVPLAVDSAITCGLIINELISNSLKYAFPQKAASVRPADAVPEVCVEMGRREGGIVVLKVGDNGVGIPSQLDFRKAESLGFQLVATLTDQLQGKLALERDRGTHITIEFPA